MVSNMAACWQPWLEELRVLRLDQKTAWRRLSSAGSQQEGLGSHWAESDTRKP